VAALAKYHTVINGVPAIQWLDEADAELLGATPITDTDTNGAGDGGNPETPTKARRPQDKTWTPQNKAGA
jgi:hypothetical protein